MGKMEGGWKAVPSPFLKQRPFTNWKWVSQVNSTIRWWGAILSTCKMNQNDKKPTHNFVLTKLSECPLQWCTKWSVFIWLFIFLFNLVPLTMLCQTPLSVPRSANSNMELEAASLLHWAEVSVGLSILQPQWTQQLRTNQTNWMNWSTIIFDDTDKKPNRKWMDKSWGEVRKCCNVMN